jgi:hypothetical protein
MLTAPINAQMDKFTAIRKRLQRTLMRLMCRTERVCRTLARDAMLTEESLKPDFRVNDLSDLKALADIGQALGSGNTVEYWKSSPYLLNFMKEYRIKERFNAERADNPVIKAAIRNHRGTFLPVKKIKALKPIDPGNAKLRTLVREIEDQQLWRLLWMPPSLPYWQPDGPYRNVDSISKQLIFSSWNVVPDALSAIISYAVQRHMLDQSKFNTYDNRTSLSLPLTYKKSDGRPNAMSAFALFFPSPALVSAIDPAVYRSQGSGTDPIHKTIQRTVSALAPMMVELENAEIPHGSERTWFWRVIACVTATRNPTVMDWCTSGMGLAENAAEGSGVGLALHQRTFAEGATDALRPPAGFDRWLARLSLAGPGNCALGALKRVAPNLLLAD